MIHHVLGLFTHPDQEWKEIKGEEETIGHMYLTHVLILAAIPAVSAYIGTTQVGWSFGAAADAVRLTQASAMQMTILAYLAMLAGVAVMGAFIHWMARTYDSSPTLTDCVVFAAYTATPLFLAGIAGLYPSLWLGMLVGTAAIAYTAFLLYQGIPIFMDIPKEEGFMFSSSILAVGLVVLVAMIATSVIFWGLGVGPEYLR
ncbi:MAG: YIP1 family protein [Pseudomonadaceae bacterium]|nr:MAG: YIP1 family protein [Pseudomonadaceae bacterium]